MEYGVKSVLFLNVLYNAIDNFMNKFQQITLYYALQKQTVMAMVSVSLENLAQSFDPPPSPQSGGVNASPPKTATEATWAIIHGIFCMACKKKKRAAEHPPAWETLIRLTDVVCVQLLVPRKSSSAYQ